MNKTFAVSTERLETSSSDVASISTDIEGTVAAMTSRLVSLQDEWSGTASTTFQDLLVEWRATQRQVKESLDSIGEALRGAGEAYSAAEAGVEAVFRTRG